MTWRMDADVYLEAARAPCSVGEGLRHICIALAVLAGAVRPTKEVFFLLFEKSGNLNLSSYIKILAFMI